MSAFLSLCIEEGLDDDEIVILTREHAPTKAAFEYDPEAVVERLLKKLRAEAGTTEPQFLDWTTPVPAAGTTAWCIGDWLEQGDSGSLVGPPKVGKSLVALEAAASKAAGTSFLGRKVAPGAVLYLDYENREDAVRKRLSDMGFAFPDLANLKYACFPTLPPLDTQSGGEALRRLVGDTCAELVVIDTLQRVVTGEENSSQGIRDLYRHTLMPLRASGVSVLRLDHLGKGDQSTARGSSAKLDDVDQAWLLKERKDGLYSLRRTHTRSGNGQAKYVLQRDLQPLSHQVVDGADDETEDAGPGADPVEDLVAKLDRLGLDNELGRNRAAAALKQDGISFGTEKLMAALKIRQARG